MDTVFRQLNPHACLTYLVGAQGSSDAAIIDPILEHVNDYVELVQREKMKLTYVIETHTHADHISGSAALKDLIGCEYIMHEAAPARCVTYLPS